MTERPKEPNESAVKRFFDIVNEILPIKENSELYYTKEELEELKGKQKTAGGYHWEYI